MAGLLKNLSGLLSEKWNQALRGFGIRNEKIDTDAILSGDFLIDPDSFRIPLAPSAIQDINKLLLSADSNLERVKIVESHYDIWEVFIALEQYKNVLTKNIFMSAELRARAEIFMENPKNDNLQMALRGLNLALSFTPMSEPYFVEILLRRATLFISLSNMDAYREDMKLVKKYAERMNLFGWEGIETKECLEPKKQAQKKLSSLEISELVKMKKYRDDVLFQVHGNPSATMPSASQVVLLKYAEDKNDRSLVASEDVEPGTPIIVEDPCVSVLDNISAWSIKKCFRCFKKIDRTIPCMLCTFAVYCSEECRDEDYDSGHRFECSCLDYLNAIQASAAIRLCVKAVCQTGCGKMIELMKHAEMNGSGDAATVIPGVDPRTGVFSSDSYYTLSHLKSHIVEETLLVDIYIALTLTHILDLKSAFFLEILDDQLEIRDQIFTFVASSILGNLLSFPYSAIELNQSAVVGENSEDGLFTGIYPTISMMNHSCDPNTFWVHSPNGKISVLALKEVRAGEQFTASYGFHFLSTKYKDRHEASTKQYKFECKCSACVLKWPIAKKFSTEPGQFICSFCFDYMGYSQVDLIKKCTLVPMNEYLFQYECKNCEGVFPSRGIFPRYSAYTDRYFKLRSMVQAGKALEVIPKIKDVIPYFQHTMRPPSVRAYQSQEVLQAAVDMVMEKVAKYES